LRLPITAFSSKFEIWICKILLKKILFMYWQKPSPQSKVSISYLFMSEYRLLPSDYRLCKLLFDFIELYQVNQVNTDFYRQITDFLNCYLILLNFIKFSFVGVNYKVAGFLGILLCSNRRSGIPITPARCVRLSQLTVSVYSLIIKQCHLTIPAKGPS
jgi:hypothetical protein